MEKEKTTGSEQSRLENAIVFENAALIEQPLAFFRDINLSNLIAIYYKSMLDMSLSPSLCADGFQTNVNADPTYFKHSNFNKWSFSEKPTLHP